MFSETWSGGFLGHVPRSGACTSGWVIAGAAAGWVEGVPASCSGDYIPTDLFSDDFFPLLRTSGVSLFVVYFNKRDLHFELCMLPTQGTSSVCFIQPLSLLLADGVLLYSKYHCTVSLNRTPAEKRAELESGARHSAQHLYLHARYKKRFFILVAFADLE